MGANDDVAPRTTPIDAPRYKATMHPIDKLIRCKRTVGFKPLGNEFPFRVETRELKRHERFVAAGNKILVFFRIRSTVLLFVVLVFNERFWVNMRILVFGVPRENNRVR